MVRTRSAVRYVIYGLSIAVPLLVAVLFRVKIPGKDFSFLPPIYASINAVTVLVLIAARLAIKRKNTVLHQRLMIIALLFSASFLIAYVLYHMTSESTSYGGDFGIIYYPLLISHILLSILIVPLVLFTLLYALEGNYSRHRRLARITWPVWVFVASSGVLVYLMISPYYGT